MSGPLDTDRNRLADAAVEIHRIANCLVLDALDVRDQHAARIDALAAERAALGHALDAVQAPPGDLRTRLAWLLEERVRCGEELAGLIGERDAARAEVAALKAAAEKETLEDSDAIKRLRAERDSALRLRDEAVEQMLSARGELAALQQAGAPAPAPSCTADDIRDVLLEEAASRVAVSQCLQYVDEGSEDILVADSVRELCEAVARYEHAAFAGRLDEGKVRATDFQLAQAHREVQALRDELTAVKQQLADVKASRSVERTAKAVAARLPALGPFVVTRVNTKPTVQRVYLGPAGWTTDVEQATRFDDVASIDKPRGSKVITLADARGELAALHDDVAGEP